MPFINLVFMETSNYASVLGQFETRLGHQDFIAKFEIELPTIMGKFLVEELTERLQEVDIDDNGVQFLRFYPILKDRLVECLG